MRVVSLVPSLTETLIEAGAHLVGRTRYCLYPQTAVDKIPKLGGTKTASIQQILEVKPQLVVLDREENRRELFEALQAQGTRVHVFHAESVEGMPRSLTELAARFNGEVQSKLLLQASRWAKVQESSPLVWDFKSIPGEISRMKPAFTDSSERAEPFEPQKLVYLIWRRPWMAIGPDTFITSVLKKLGAASYLIDFSEKYPKLGLAEELSLPEGCGPQNTYLLLSSEPYAFAREAPKILTDYHRSVIDGESYSWFGVRALRFLEQTLKRQAIHFLTE